MQLDNLQICKKHFSIQDLFIIIKMEGQASQGQRLQCMHTLLRSVVQQTSNITVCSKITIMSLSLESAFKGKKVLVSGSGRGIGKACVQRLHSYGAVVYALSQSPQNLENLKKECPGIKTITCDVGNWNETRNVLKYLEPMDYLLNNAGILKGNTVLKMTAEEFDEMFNVNVKGSLNVSQIIAEKMIETGKGGSICFISSVLGAKAMPGFAGYCMTKTALDMLAKSLALELGPKKIRVNVVRPGAVATDMYTNQVSETVQGLGFNPTDFNAVVEARVPYPGFWMDMDHLVNLILFTLSDMCPQMTGTEMVMDGGLLIT